MQQKRIVHLRVYVGKELNYNANGNVKNENHKVSLTHGGVEWRNYMKNLTANGFCAVKVENAFDESYEKVSFDDIEKEVKLAFEGSQEVVLTKEQQEIKELKAQMAELLAGQKPTAKPKPVKEEANEDVFVPVLPEGKTVDKMGRAELEETFPNIAELNPANVGDFRAIVKETYPNL